MFPLLYLLCEIFWRILAGRHVLLSKVHLQYIIECSDFIVRIVSSF